MPWRLKVKLLFLAAVLIPWAMAAAVFIWGWFQTRKTAAGEAGKTA
ncbi:hypothetical protein [Neomoorella thermoacetica]|nr:hypothetical protein [Moorella thermoacetica]